MIFLLRYPVGGWIVDRNADGSFKPPRATAESFGTIVLPEGPIVVRVLCELMWTERGVKPLLAWQERYNPADQSFEYWAALPLEYVTFI